MTDVVSVVRSFRAPRVPATAAAMLALAALAMPAAAGGAVSSADADLVVTGAFGIDAGVGLNTVGDVSVMPDINNDGVADILLSSGAFVGPGGLSAGRAWTFSGATGALLRTFTGTGSNDRLGSAAAPAGDVNNDGIQDIVLTAIGVQQRVVVFSTSNGAILRTNAETAQPLRAFAFGVGDFNNDGFDDYSGGGGVYSGINGQRLNVVGEDPSGGRPLGDINGDGVDDMISYNPIEDLLFTTALLGPDGAEGDVLTNLAEGVEFRGLADLSGDGLNDLVEIDTSDTGASAPDTFRFFRGVGGQTVLNTAVPFVAEDPVVAGDIDGDGIDDILISQPPDELSGDTDRTVRLISSRTGSVLRTFTHTESAEAFGTSYGAGDINGDGVPDVVIRSVSTTGNASTDGVVGYVFFSPAACPLDITGDRVINFADLNIVLDELNIHETGDPEFPVGYAADVNGDFLVNFGDLNLILGSFGESCD